MKHTMILFSMLVSASIFATNLGQGEVPAVVKEAFLKKFPDAVNAEWTQENEKEWEADFDLKGVEYSAVFASDGKWVETEHTIKISQTPLHVKQSVDKNFPDYIIENVMIIENAIGISYEFELDNGDQMLEVIIDSSGKLIKKELMRDEEDQEDEDE